MFFILSKILLIFILPLSWIIACFIIALIVKKPKLKRRFFVGGVLLLLIFTNPFLIERLANLWNIKPVPLTGRYSSVIVLGGFSGEDAYHKGVFNNASDRFIEGVKLFTTGRVSHILISSGNGNLVSDGFEEADWVKTQLQQFKIPDSCILIENRSRNTIENAAFSKVVLNRYHLPPPYVLVTSAFHMRRSLGIFKKAGINVIPYPCAYLEENKRFSVNDFTPDAAVLADWNIYIKELIGTLVNQFR